jgi:hypothetical protein
MRQEINRYVQMWEQRCYSEGIPDEAPREIDDMVPSYKRIAMAVMKNDLSIIGIEPPKTEYYSILKCIELGIIYKKSNRMTQQELRESIFRIINKMIANNCYIKGYGDKFRICDEKHSPVQNIDKRQMEVLKLNSIVVLRGLIWNLNVLANPFAHPIDIKLPVRE